MKAIVHIGGEKTGTTTIQEFCHANREILAQQGILYPASLGASNHLKLAAYALDDDNLEDDTRKYFGIKNAWGLRAFQSQVERDLESEMREHGSAKVALLSNELIQSRLTKMSEIEKLRDLLISLFSHVTIVIYLRRQDRVAVSHYSTKLKSDTDDDGLVFPAINAGTALPHYFDYDTTLRQFEDVFGRENVNVRLLEPSFLKDGDLLSDFCFTCGIDHNEQFVPVARENESLSPNAIAFYRKFNQRVPRFVGQGLNPLRSGLNTAMAKAFGGRGPDVAAADAKAFYKYFVEGNRQIARRYLPFGDANLFTDDFSMYRDHSRDTVDPEALIDIATHLWIERSVEIEKLRLENYLIRFTAGFAKQPRQIPSPPLLSVGPHTPGNLAVHWLGAMLYLGENHKAAEAASAMMDGAKVLPAYVVAQLFALLRLGDKERFAAAFSAEGVGPKIAASLKCLRERGVDKLKGEAMIRAFKTGDPISQQAYKRMFEWIEHI